MEISETNPAKVKLLWLRLLLDDLRSLLHGWYFRIVSLSARVPLDTCIQSTLSDVSIKINWREELGELNHSRIHNMGLGCQLVNGVMLRPGDVFSLRRFFRDTTAEQGFQSGPIFLRGRTDFITGGGTCLVSTLLFNAALHANLEILEKHNHSTDLWGEDRFIGLGLDATYVYGRKDLKFRNSHTSDVLIVAELSRSDLLLQCRLLSHQPLLHKVSVITDIEQELHPETKDSPYRKGWIVTCKRFVQGYAGKHRVTYNKTETYKPYVLPSQQQLST